MGQIGRLLVIIFFLSGLGLRAQEILSVRKIKLPGKLVEYKNGNVVFVPNSGAVLELDRDSIENDSRVTASKANYYVYKTSVKEKGLYGQVDICVLFPRFANAPTPSVSGTIGYKFWPYLNAGVGAGFEKYDQKTLTPVFLRLSGVAADQRVAPYYDVSGGYAFAKSTAKARWDGELDPRAKGGFRFYPQVGFIFQDRVSTFIAFGYLTQRVTTTTGFIDWQGNLSKTTISRTLNIYTLRLGFTF